jgi:hypothetical protein
MNKHIFSVSLTTVLICGAVLRTEAQDIRLSYGVGIADGGEKTDGVTFRVELHREGHEPVVLSEEKWAQNAWHDTEVDLTPYAEQKVRLRFVTEPGETTTDDWACWYPGDMAGRENAGGPDGNQAVADRRDRSARGHPGTHGD